MDDNAQTSEAVRVHHGLEKCETEVWKIAALTPGLHVNAKVHIFEKRLLSVVAKVNTCTQTQILMK